MSPARERAVVALNKIFKRGKKPREVLEALSWENDKRERAFLMELVYGVLRYRDLLDWMLKDFLRKPAGLSFDTINNLRIAVYQIAYMRVPEWAAVNEAVDVEKAQRGKTSLVNAVLRNFLRRRESISPPEDDLAIATSHPGWLIKRWVKRFGPEGALRLAKKNNEIPTLTLRIDEAPARERALSVFASKGVQVHKTLYSPSGLVLEDLHSFSELQSLLDFPCLVQDEAAQLITFLLAPCPEEIVLDACAAPGGKTTHIAELMRDKGKVVAVETEERRIRQLEENITRLGLHSVAVVPGNLRDAEAGIRRAAGCEPASSSCLFDRILLDAPCSALGVIRRNPDVKYRHRPRDLQKFRENQLALLRAASRYLKAGGSIVYSVCSTEPEEGEEVIGAFLHSNQNFSIIRGEHDFLRPFEYGDSGRVFYRTFPHEHDMDGFFAARLKRIG
ncbi:MAG TPA: 16S rRNA (cytosine(967)-C(5))-methyltransferase RsmB [Dissulfurispiraceae bacterium]|nr:16S rRNA (cytosine(967)-C(5))-methyltransferase RsmB [Dissulfurispiraceae bacterium]